MLYALEVSEPTIEVYTSSNDDFEIIVYSN
jgi:hypothetical protein